MRTLHLYNVDHLEAIVRENVRVRERELTHCHEIIFERAEALMNRLLPVAEPARRPFATASQSEWILTGVVACAQ